MLTIGQHYPCGPCEFPVQCTCGFVITKENVVNYSCEEECEICEYCGTGKCPECGNHRHCGGCI